MLQWGHILKHLLNTLAIKCKTLIIKLETQEVILEKCVENLCQCQRLMIYTAKGHEALDSPVLKPPPTENYGRLYHGDKKSGYSFICFKKNYCAFTMCFILYYTLVFQS